MDNKEQYTGKFIVWLVSKQEWIYDDSINLWVKDGYRSRTTEEVFEWYNKYIAAK